jgi:MEMO1 family protein
MSPSFLLRDRAGLTTQQIVVSLPALYLIELADGTRTLDQIVKNMRETTGLVVEENQIADLMNSLDERFLLDNARARKKLHEVRPRPAVHAGSGYPLETPELEAFLDDIIGDAPEASPTFSPASILPHIDFFRGRDSYQAGYRHLHGLASSGEGPINIVILGISHALASTPFILTHKDFDTPLGVVETNSDLIDRLSQGLPFDPFRDEYNHLSEHSVEFHAVVLKRLMGQRPFKIVPILCCSFHEAILGDFSPLKLGGVREFLGNLEELKELGNVHFLASVDLAHMGMQFGGERLNRGFLKQLKNRDLESLKGVSNGKADEFFATHQRDKGERNYCGTPAIYTLLQLFPLEFTLHKYQQCTDPDLSSTVTVCAATLK